MKRILALLLALVTILCCFAACGKKADEDKTDNTPDTSAVQPTETDKVEEPVNNLGVNPDDYDFFQVFPVPKGESPRQLVVSEMRAMSQIPWTVSETFDSTLRDARPDLSVNLTYIAGKTYYGVPYGNTSSDKFLFQNYVKDGVFTPNSPYYEDIIGNNCSTSMCIALQYAINFPTRGGTYKPCEFRGDVLEFCGNMKVPDDPRYDSADTWKINDKETIFQAFSELKPGDILYKSIRDASGHTRLVASEAIMQYKSNGEPNYPRCSIKVIESTNAWNADQTSTWWVDKVYYFTELYETMFMPVRVKPLDVDIKELEDAYIGFQGELTPESIVKGFKGTVSSNFPLTHVRVVITDTQGNIVKVKNINSLNNVYSQVLTKLTFDKEITTTDLPAGQYHFSLTAAIARGCCEIKSFDFTIG